MLHYLLVVMFLSNAHGQDSVPLHAINCEHALEVHNLDAQELCQSAFVEKRESKTFLVAQIVQSTVHNGLKCDMRSSKFDLICGFLSHEKLLAIPEINKADPIRSSACEDLFKYSSTARIDNLAISTLHGSENQYRYVKAGSIRHTDNNVVCQGGTVQIDGQNISSVVEMITRTLKTENVQFEVSIDEKVVIDLTNNDKLSSDVLTPSKNYWVNSKSYYVNYTKPKCDAVKIDTMTFDLIDYEDSQWLISEKRKLALKIMGETTVCNQTALKTQYSHIVLFNDTQSVLDSLNGIFVDLYEEEQLTSDFLTFKEARDLSKVKSRICQEIRANAHILPSPFHPFSFLRIRNDLITELVCKQVTVHAILNENRRSFCTETLPVFYKNKQFELQANTKLLLENFKNNTLTKVPCNPSMLPVFASIDRKVMLTATPLVTRYNVTLSHVDHSFNETSVNELTGQELLYSHEQIRAWKEYLSFRHVHNKLMYSLTHTVCQQQECGDFIPGNSESETSFPIHLLNPIDTLSNWLRNELFYFLAKLGSICSIFIGFYCILTWILKLVHFCTLTSQNVTYRDALRHIILPAFPKNEIIPPMENANAVRIQEVNQPLMRYIPPMYR